MQAPDDDEFEVEGDFTIHGVTNSLKLVSVLEGTETDPQGNERVGLSDRGRSIAPTTA